jgi:hypothetical protein
MASLNEIPKKSPFKVPENYFDEVNRKILSAATVSKPDENKIRFLYRFRSKLAIAASITGLIILSYTAIKILSPSGKTSEISDVIYMEENSLILEDIDIMTLEENVSSYAIYSEIPELSRSEIIDYLLSENIEISEIYEKF